MLKHEDESGTNGDGQKTLEELVAKYNKVTDEVIRGTMEKKLVDTSIKQGQDPDDYFVEKTLAQIQGHFRPGVYRGVQGHQTN